VVVVDVAKKKKKTRVKIFHTMSLVPINYAEFGSVYDVKKIKRRSRVRVRRR
jgi:hypothetical protein